MFTILLLVLIQVLFFFFYQPSVRLTPVTIMYSSISANSEADSLVSFSISKLFWNFKTVYGG
jgi:hypothetical protein